MPLVKGTSPKAFDENVKAEKTAGKPLKQALAVAYSVQREASRKAGKKIAPKASK